MTRATLYAALLLGAMAAPASAGVLWTEGWDIDLAPNSATHALPDGWQFANADPADGATWSGIYNPAGYPGPARFDSTGPLAGPASGNNFLFLSGPQTIVWRDAGATLQSGVTYALSAALGADKAFALDNSTYWTLQLWAGAYGQGGTLLGTLDRGSPGANALVLGGWVLNTLSYTATAEVEGQELIVALGSQSPYFYAPANIDSVSLSEVAAVPEPASLALFGSGLLGLLGLGARRRPEPA